MNAVYPALTPDFILWDFSLARGLQAETLWYMLYIGGKGGVKCRLIPRRTEGSKAF